MNLSSERRHPGHKARLGRALVLALVPALLISLPGCAMTADGPSREEIRAYLDATFDSDPNRPNTWLSDEPVEETADTIEDEVEPRDRVEEGQAVFMRDDDWAIAVFPEPSGSRIQYDDYNRIRTRYLPLIGGFWGVGLGSYGPRGTPGGGFRGGGPGFGK